ncbi:MAG: hypothetical protein LUC43_08935, partial [Burkholderiales bacterium]|nr:hypothetical protein [Burkholderiales bacterium]
MDKVLISVAGPDRAGVVYSVAEAVYELKCNFVDMSQTNVVEQVSSMMIMDKASHVTKARFEDNIPES